MRKTLRVWPPLSQKSEAAVRPSQHHPSNHRGNPAKNNATRLFGTPGSALRLVSCPTWVARAETLRRSNTFIYSRFRCFFSASCCLLGADKAKILMRNNDGIHLKCGIHQSLVFAIYVDVFIFCILTSLDAFKALAWGFMGLSCTIHSSQSCHCQSQTRSRVSSR